MRLDVGSYNLEELTEATEYYRDKANALALQVNRDGSGNVGPFADFDALAGKAGEGFQTLTYDYFYPIFAGSTLPVKKLGWADMYSSMGITGVTFGLTGEACVNPQIPGVSLPFTMCHEMAHPHVHRPGAGRQFCRVPRRLRPFRPGIPVQRLLYGLPLLLQRPEQRQ